MPKRISKRITDANQRAAAVVALATVEIDPATLSGVMAAMGRKGGRIGGKRRLETMTAAQRKRVAKKAAQARWKK